LIDFSKLLDWSYWLNPRPGASFQFGILILIKAGVLLVLAFLIKPFIKKITKGYAVQLKFAKKLSTLLWVTAISALVLFFSRMQNLPVLSMRLLWPILAFTFVIWLIIILLWAKRNIPREIAKVDELKRKEAFLPKRKKSK